MRPRLLAVPLLAAFALLLPNANAASTAFVVSDPTGDANFSGLHKTSLPGSQPGFDIASAGFDTTKAITSYKTIKVKGKKKKVPVYTATGIVVTLTMASEPSTEPGSSYGLSGTHSVCENLRMQIYYSDSGPQTYGDLSKCGQGSATSTNKEQFSIAFSPKIVGKTMVLAIPFKALPKEFKVGTFVDNLVAYTSVAEFVVAGYQPTDFEPSAGIDIVTADKPWKIA